MSCSGSDDVSALPGLTEFRESRIPSALGLDDEAPTVAFEEVVGRLAQECMRERGFQVPAANLVPQSSGPPGGRTNVEVQRDSLSETAFAAEFGFGIASSGVENYRAGVQSPLQDFVASLTRLEADALLYAFYGDVTAPEVNDGCLATATAQAQVEMGQDRWQLFGVYAQDVQERSDSDSRTVALHEEYATCMASKGHAYAVPLQARFAASRRFSEWARTAQVDDQFAENHLDGLTNASRSAWERLLRLEVEEALASIGCEALIRTELVAIYAEVEQAWLVENGERIALDLEQLGS